MRAVLTVTTAAHLRYLIKSLQHHDETGAISRSTTKERNLGLGDMQQLCWGCAIASDGSRV